MFCATKILSFDKQVFKKKSGMKAAIDLQTVEFFLLLQPASEETVVNEKMDLGNVRDENTNNLFQNKFAGMKKIVTFAARFGRTGSWINPAKIEKRRRKNMNKKIKFILFGS